MASGVQIAQAHIVVPPTVGQAPPRNLPELKQSLDVWTRKVQLALSGIHASVASIPGQIPAGYTHANFLADFSAETTDNLTEGVTNLYWSQALFNAALAGASGTFVFTFPQFLTYLNTASGVTIAGASGTFSFLTAWNDEITVSSPLFFNSSSGILSIQQATTSQNGYLSSADWNTFNGKFPYNKAVRSVVLCAAYTPFVTGADTAEVTIPYNGDGSSETFTITRLVLRVGTAGGAPQIKIELSTASGVFVPITVGTVTLTSGANEGFSTAGFTTTTCVSGNKLRFNVLSLGSSASNWCVQVEILPQ